MRSRTVFLSLFGLIAVGIVAPHFAHATVPFFGPIIPDASNACPANFPLLIQVVNNIIQLLITLVIIIVAPIMIAYAGFIYVTKGSSDSERRKANQILLNIVIGIVVVCAAWLFIDAVLSVFTPQGLSSWSSLVLNNGNGESVCLSQAGTSETSLTSGYTSLAVGGGLSNVTPGTAPTPVSNSNGYYSFGAGTGPCSASEIAKAASDAGLNITQSEANTFACIAVPESSCNPNQTNGTWGKPISSGPDAGKYSSAVGAWQVLLNTNAACFNNSTCESVVGATGPLNCQNAFDSNGKPITGTLLNNCVTMAENWKCNLVAAVCVKGSGNNWSPWTADPRSATQQACITKYAN